ncbi:MAG: hypothetical protein ACE5FB_01360 [Candidatus Binatia bacterium]
MGLSEGDIAKAAREPGSIELCMKALFQTTEELENHFESLQQRLGPILRERNPEIEQDRTHLTPASELTVPVSGKSGLAVELVTVIQKIRLMKVQSESILRNLDL